MVLFGLGERCKLWIKACCPLWCLKEGNVGLQWWLLCWCSGKGKKIWMKIDWNTVLLGLSWCKGKQENLNENWMEHSAAWPELVQGQARKFEWKLNGTHSAAWPEWDRAAAAAAVEMLLTLLQPVVVVVVVGACLQWLCWCKGKRKIWMTWKMEHRQCCLAWVRQQASSKSKQRIKALLPLMLLCCNAVMLQCCYAAVLQCCSAAMLQCCTAFSLLRWGEMLTPFSKPWIGGVVFQNFCY